ncbi:hypothetical protein WJX77_001565 [Trebouxia sp. C0004]
MATSWVTVSGYMHSHKKYQLWELQTHCLVTLLAKRGFLTVDEVCLLVGFHRAKQSNRACLLRLPRNLFTK